MSGWRVRPRARARPMSAKTCWPSRCNSPVPICCADMDALFTSAMALREVQADGDDPVYEGELNEHWTIGPKVHGGAMVALCGNAARTAYGNGLQPVAV